MPCLSFIRIGSACRTMKKYVAPTKLYSLTELFASDLQCHCGQGREASIASLTSPWQGPPCLLKLCCVCSADVPGRGVKTLEVQKNLAGQT